MKARLIEKIISFLAGALVCYFLCQYSYLTIDPVINVWESILSFISIVIGLFIAITIQSKFNRNQNLYNFLVPRLDILWSEFNNLRSLLEASDNAALSSVTKIITDLQRKNSDFDKLLIDFKLNNNFEILSEELRNLMEKSMIKNNVVYYHDKKPEIIEVLKKISENYINIFKELNNKA